MTAANGKRVVAFGKYAGNAGKELEIGPRYLFSSDS
jgi:hypothetical protein